MISDLVMTLIQQPHSKKDSIIGCCVVIYLAIIPILWLLDIDIFKESDDSPKEVDQTKWRRK